MTYKGHEQYTASTCSVCLLPIHDQSLFRVNENYYHSLCLNCSECHTKLVDKCYVKDGHIYCKEDFFKKFGTICSSCGNPIPSSDIVQRANEYVYHIHCFTCTICHKKITKNQQYYLINDKKLLCKIDYDTLKNKEFDNLNKRARTIITQNQLEILKQAYNLSSKPPRHMRESLALQTGLDMRVVQVWFQNRRAKEKRYKKDSTKGKRSRVKSQDEDISNEYDTTISHDMDLSEHDSDSSLSHIRQNNSIYSNNLSHIQHNQLIPINSSYTELRIID